MTFVEDFNILNNAVVSFLKSDETKIKLQHILTKSNHDWEKWLQVELAYHLEKNCRCEVLREVPAKSDQRYRIGKFSIYVDLLIRKKKFAPEDYIFIELKCDGTADTLLKKMKFDAKKLESIKGSFLNNSETKMRSYWCIGFFRRTEHISVREVKQELKESYTSKSECKIYNICNCFNHSEDCKCKKIGYIIF